MALYEIALFGEPSKAHLKEFKSEVKKALDEFRLEIGVHVSVQENPASFKPSQRTCAVALYFGHAGGSRDDLKGRIDVSEMTVLPVASTALAVGTEIPKPLQALNCLFLDQHGMQRVVTATLECLGLLRTQRKLFLSYRRSEATKVALQLFSELSARGYEIFLDTHNLPPADDFQETLWHRLCDVDVMVMLETKTYFASRWTTEEFGKALAKNIGVLRIQWPDATPNIHTGTSSRVELIKHDFSFAKRLTPLAIARIADQLERFRSMSLAVRRLAIASHLQEQVERIGGKILGIGPHFSTTVLLPGNRTITIHPVLGVPDATSAQESIQRAVSGAPAVLFDHVGIRRSWMDHLDWLGRNLKGTRWIRLSEAASDLSGVWP